jgi:hypothetical protein
MYKILITIFFLGLIENSVAQTTLATQEIELAYHCDVMANAFETKHRAQAFEKFYTLFKSALAVPRSYEHPFDELKWISKKYAADRSFRVITWEVQTKPNDYKYYGFIQKSDGTLYELTDNFKRAETIEEEVSNDAWYGALYYHLQEVKMSNGQMVYMLYGQNKWGALEHKKLIDVLFFSKEGEPYFGKKIFKVSEKGEVDVLYNRLVFTYAADSRMTLNYNPGLEMIVHDHLIPKLSRIEELSKTMVPDGSYMAWQWDKKNHWVLIDKLATQVMESAPRPTPVLDERKGKAIFGGNKKNK